MSVVLNFDASTVAPDTGVQDPVPAGWYDVIIDQSELKPTKNNDGAYLEVRHNILSGTHAGKKVYARLNLRNSNPTAQEIGFKQLSAICHAIGVLQVADSSQLHNIPLKIKVKLRPAQGDYEASNEVTSWKNINEVVNVAAAVSNGFPTMAPAVPTPPLAPPAATMPPAAPQWQTQAPPQMPPAVQAPQAPAWQPPANPQPWAQQQPPQPQPAPQAAPQPPMQQPPMQPPAPPQQPQQPAPQQAQAAPPWNGAQTAVPPWMTPPPAQGQQA